MHVKKVSRVFSDGEVVRTHTTGKYKLHPLDDDPDEKVAKVKSKIHTPAVVAIAARERADKIKDLYSHAKSEASIAAKRRQEVDEELKHKQDDSSLQAKYNQSVLFESLANQRKDQAKSAADEAEAFASEAEMNAS
jgi:hypothetical protein